MQQGAGTKLSDAHNANDTLHKQLSDRDSSIEYLRKAIAHLEKR